MMENRRLLLVSTDPALGNAVQDWCRSKSYHITIATTTSAALSHLTEPGDLVVVVDHAPEDATTDVPNQALIEFLHRQHAGLTCILLLDVAHLPDCQSLINGGMIFRSLFKPFSHIEAQRALTDACSFQELKASHQDVAERLQRLSFSWQSRFEEKNREVALQAKRLQIAQVLFDALPSVILGISLDGTVVEANEQARTLFDERGLIGCSMATLLPADAQALINKCLEGGGMSTASFSVTLRGNLLQFQCITFLLSGVIQGCLLYGGSKS